MIDKKLTEWLYYITPYRDALDIGENDDPKYIELHYPHSIKFNKLLLESSLKEFVSIMVWVFRDQYPFEYSYIQVSQIEKDGKGKLLFNTNKRKLNDIEPLEFEEISSKLNFGLLSLKIKFKQPQISVFNWVEEALEGKVFEKTVSPDMTTYTVSESPIEKLEVTQNYVFIKVKEDSIIY